MEHTILPWMCVGLAGAQQIISTGIAKKTKLTMQSKEYTVMLWGGGRKTHTWTAEANADMQPDTQTGREDLQERQTDRQETRLSPGRPGFESRWRGFHYCLAAAVQKIIPKSFSGLAVL